MNEKIKTELYHKWSKDEKKRYNAEYYQKHKEYWKARAESDSKARDALKKMQRYGKYINEIRYDKDPNPVTGVSGVVGFEYPYYDGTYIRKIKPTPKTPYGTVNAGEAQEYWKAKKAYKDARKARKTYSEGLTALEGGRINPLEGSVAYRQALKYKGYGDAASRPAPSARVDKTVGSHDRGDYKYASKSFEKIATKADELRRKANWKTAPIKNKATRKAKEFVSNWKSGASSISSAAKSASSKLGKHFLRW